VRQREAEDYLESLLLEGLASGEAKPMTPEDWDSLRRNVLERLAQQRS
jgi:antitoxin ParD1/3/4